MQNFGGQTRCIMGDAQMTNAIFEKKRLHLRTLVNLRNRSRVIIISPQLKKLSAKLYIPLYCIVFLLHPIDKQTRTHARTHKRTKVNIEQDNIYIPLNRSFCTRAENINVKWRSWQDTQVIALSRLLHTTEFCRILPSAVLLHKLTITKQTAHSYSW